MKLFIIEDEVPIRKELTHFFEKYGFQWESSVNLNARCWAVQEDFWPAKWRLTEAVKYALDEAGIRIPYPQVDVHLDK